MACGSGLKYNYFMVARQEDVLITLVVDLKKSRRAGRTLPHDKFVQLGLGLQNAIRASYEKLSSAGENFTGDGMVLLFHPRYGRDAVIFSLSLIETWRQQCKNILGEDDHYPLHIGIHIGNVTIDGPNFVGHCISIAKDLSTFGEDVVIVPEGLRDVVDINLFEHHTEEVILQEAPLKIYKISARGRGSLEGRAKNEPEDASSCFLLGLEAQFSNHYEKAKVYYEKSLEIDQSNAQAHRNLGIVLAKLGRKDSAEAEFREALKIGPADAKAHNNLGLLLKDLKRYPEAEIEYREAIRIEPSFAVARGNLGNLLVHLGRRDEAEIEYREAIRIEPNLAGAFYNLGVVLLSKMKEGVVSLRRAVELDPKLREFAKTDPDIEPFRCLPEVSKLLQEPQDPGTGF